MVAYLRHLHTLKSFGQNWQVYLTFISLDIYIATNVRILSSYMLIINENVKVLDLSLLSTGDTVNQKPLLFIVTKIAKCFGGLTKVTQLEIMLAWI